MGPSRGPHPSTDPEGHVARPIIIGRSAAIQAICGLAERVAEGDAKVLITGESGVGNELLVRQTHHAPSRRGGPFVAVSCGAVAESLLESELFGHARGAFTGADRDRIGLFEQAAGGTLFLDEIGETSPAMQVKLQRALQEGEIRRVGETRGARGSWAKSLKPTRPK